MAACQIYHVARCGSTLLSHILANNNEVYNEPSWSDCMLCMHTINQISDKVVVKFCSTNSVYDFDPSGKKVFLYRPLAQHILKLKNIEQSWIKDRLLLVENFIAEKRINDIIDLTPKTDYEKFALFWLISILNIKNKSNVMWIRTNDFLENKIDISNKVCEHFNIQRVNNFDIIKYNVKEIRKEIKKTISREMFYDRKVELNEFFKFDIDKYGAKSTHGKIDSEIAMKDSEIEKIVSTISKIMPQLEEHLY